ncbi:MAG: NfeD family protein [Bacteroidales bacterium]
MNHRIKALLSFFIYLSILSSYAQKKVYYQIDLKKEIGSTTWIYVKKGLNEAAAQNADGVFLNMNTYGGTVVHADSIRTAILNSTFPVYAFIDNNAASAGALIAIACDSIYMRPGANIGAVTVVNQTGAAMPDKYQSYMRSTIRSTAESHGKDTIIENGVKKEVWRRDPLIAEAMVDERVVVPGLVDSTKVLTFTTSEAIKYRFCEGEASNIDDIIKNRFRQTDYEIRHYRPTTMDNVMGWLTSPGIQAFLIMIIVLGIYYELQSPGVGFPTIAALTAAALYFAPLYLEGLAQYWEIALFFIGIILLILELFLFPGFGIAGILGVLLMTAALIFALINNWNLDFQGVEIPDANKAVLTVVVGLGLGFAAMLLLMNRIGRRGFLRRVALTKEESLHDGFIAVPMKGKELIGRIGVAGTILRPAGKVLLDNEYFDAVALYGYIDKGKVVKVVKYENAQLYVIIEE